MAEVRAQRALNETSPKPRVSVSAMATSWSIGVYRRTISSLLLLFLSLLSISIAYKPGDIVPMSRMGQYHSSRTPWHDIVGRHCPIFAVNREVLIPIPKPTGYTGADPYKLSFQIGREKFRIPWLLVVNRKSPEVPMIEFHLRYSDIEIHPDISKQFWDPEHWPKHILVRYTWSVSLHLNLNPFNHAFAIPLRELREEKSEIDVASGFYVLFGSGLVMSFILSIYVLQSSRDRLARFLRETVAESSMPGGGVAKVE
ncbi:hypothetical protein RJ641_024483 [Dillenia turbinata]|uniref:Uncharacterized protein n=1 Tax=Dillenia turbinata TaxID=194707 RepID=A0AAN8ZML4_9MAGN